MKKIEAKPLVITNDNNKLACEAFIVIHFAPAEMIHETEMCKSYLVKHGDDEIYCQLVDFVRIPFGRIGSLITLPATGLESDAWSGQWLKRYPKTNVATEMAVYYYKRVKVER